MSSKQSITRTRAVSMNPEILSQTETLLQVQRMQYLLEEYDEENSFLNRQIEELLELKKKSETSKNSFARSKRDLEQTNNSIKQS